MGRIRVGPARIPDRESPERAIELLLERGYDACEIDFESGFWMDYPWAERLGELAREHDVALSVHAPLFGFVGHLEASGRKWSSALGALDRSAGIARPAAPRSSSSTRASCSAGAARTRSRRSSSSSALVRERLEGKGRAVPFGVEVMGRVRDLGSLDDCVEIAARAGWVRPVLDFAHMHATSDGAFLEAAPFAEALELADDVLEPGAPFHIHFSDIAYANRNETQHLPYGEGTLRADPLREALAGFDRPATVISESPDEASSQAIRGAQMIRAALSGSKQRVQPLLELRGLLVAAALAQELRQRGERLGLGVAVVRLREDVERLAQQQLRLSSRPWAARTSPSTIRTFERDIMSCIPTVSTRRQRPALGLLDVALGEHHLGERPLCLDDLAALLQREQRAHRLAHEPLRPVAVALLPDGDALELLRARRVRTAHRPPRRARAPSRTPRRPRRTGPRRSSTRPADTGRPGSGRDAAAGVSASAAALASTSSACG